MSMKPFLNIPAVLLLGLAIAMASPAASRAGPLTASSDSPPALSGLPGVSAPENLIEARYYWHHHHYWHRHHYWRRHYWHRWHYHRAYWHRHYWYHHHYWHRPYWHRWHYWHPHYHYRRYWY